MKKLLSTYIYIYLSSFTFSFGCLLANVWTVWTLYRRVLCRHVGTQRQFYKNKRFQSVAGPSTVTHPVLGHRLFKKHDYLNSRRGKPVKWRRNAIVFSSSRMFYYYYYFCLFVCLFFSTSKEYTLLIVIGMKTLPIFVPEQQPIWWFLIYGIFKTCDDFEYMSDFKVLKILKLITFGLRLGMGKNCSHLVP